MPTTTSLRSALASAVLLGVLSVTGSARAQAAVQGPVTVKVVGGSGTQTYQVPWMLNMSFLNAVELALPSVPKVGAFSLNYYPEFGGYIIAAVGGVPASGTPGYWSTCLLPAGPGSTVVTLPLAPNKILVGPGDTLSLLFAQPCPAS